MHPISGMQGWRAIEGTVARSRPVPARGGRRPSTMIVVTDRDDGKEHLFSTASRDWPPNGADVVAVGRMGRDGLELTDVCDVRGQSIYCSDKVDRVSFIVSMMRLLLSSTMKWLVIAGIVASVAIVFADPGNVGQENALAFLGCYALFLGALLVGYPLLRAIRRGGMKSARRSAMEAALEKRGMKVDKFY